MVPPFHPFFPTDPSTIYHVEAASAKDRSVNILSTNAIDQLVAGFRASRRLTPFPIIAPTGVVQTWVSHFAGKHAQAHIPVDSLARTELLAFRELGKLGDCSLKETEKVSVSALMYRWTHRNAAGLCDPVRWGLEISHRAEAFHSTEFIKDWKPGHKVELTTAERWYQNEGRKYCSMTAANWHRADTGDLIPKPSPDGPWFTGATLCPHRLSPGGPCLAPYPPTDDQGRPIYSDASLERTLARSRQTSGPSPGIWREVTAYWSPDAAGVQRVRLDPGAAEAARCLEDVFASTADFDDWSE